MRWTIRIRTIRKLFGRSVLLELGEWYVILFASILSEKVEIEIYLKHHERDTTHLV